MMNSTSLDLGTIPAAPGLPGAPPAIAAGLETPDFARALTDLLVGVAPAAMAGAAVTGRQDAAASGKAMPVAPLPMAREMPVCELLDPALLPIPVPTAAEEIPGEADIAPELSDPDLEPALAWLLPPPVVLTPPTGDVAPCRSTVPDCEMPAPPVDAAGPRIPLGPVTTGSVTAGPVTNGPVKAGPIATGPVATGPALPSVGQSENGKPVETPSNPAAPARSDRPAPPPRVNFEPRREAPPIILTVPEVARIAASAAQAAVVPLEPAAATAPTSADSAILSVSATAAPLAVAASSSAQQAGIDLTRDPGLHRMIDRIEQLRDGADVRETRIRLIPDSLGPVDIAVRRDDGSEGVRVHFTAAEAATRQLIADAQHRLTELADARGVRIERAIIDGGGAQSWGRDEQSPQQQPQQQSAPARSRAQAGAANDAEAESTDTRIA